MATFIIIGLTAGILSGLFGIGGGILIVPALIFFAKFAPQTATGTSLAALLLPVGALGVWQYHQRGQVNFTAAFIIAGGLFFGAYFGAMATARLSATQLQRAFAVFLVVVAIRMWWKA
jgi:uncharacterized membrane protein YfcA